MTLVIAAYCQNSMQCLIRDISVRSTEFEVSHDEVFLRSYRPHAFLSTTTAVFTQSAFVPVSLATAWLIRSSNPGRGKQSFSSPEGLPSFLSSVHRNCFPGINRPGVNLATHLHLVPRLRMSGVPPLLPLYGFIAWTGNTSPSPPFMSLIR